MAIRVALDLDVYNTLSSDDGSPKSAAQLAAPKGADPVLIGECFAFPVRSIHPEGRKNLRIPQETDGIYFHQHQPG